MSNRLEFATKVAEPHIAAELEKLGFVVAPYGQGLLTDAARKMLEHEATPERWTPDFLVARRPIVDTPRWPKEMRDKYTFLVDVKYRLQGQQNYSIEMRSLIAASTFGMDVYYVCGTRDGNKMAAEIGVVGHSQVTRGWGVRPCCGACWNIYTQSPNQMKDLPTYCPDQRKDKTASGTPYIILSAERLDPLNDYVFDNLRMAYFVGEKLA
jgi:hypothetical protein